MATLSYNDIARSIYLALEEKQGGGMHAGLEDTVKFLARRKLLSKAPAILEALQKIINREKKRVEARVSGAHKLATTTKHDIIAALTRRYKAEEVTIHEEVDESLIAGFKIKVGDEVIDLSARNKINKLREQLIK